MGKTDQPAGVAVDRGVRPLYYWHEGPNGDCFRVELDEADGHCDCCTAVYDRAALDAAVAAERERCADIVRNAAAHHGLCCSDCNALADLVAGLGA